MSGLSQTFFSQITKHLSIFNDVEQVWSEQKFDGKYAYTEQFCGGNDTLEAYKQIKNPRYTETEIDYYYNEHNFRVPLRDYTCDNTKEIIACFGCSDTFGAGLPWKETWPAQLEALLGNKFTVRNYGLCGASSDQIVRLASIYLEKHTPKALLCMMPDIFRREFFENNRNKLSLKQFYPVDDIYDFNQKIPTLKDINAMDWWAYKRLSKPDNSIYNFIKNIKFIEAVALSRNIPLHIFSWSEYLIDVFYKKHFESTSICIPTEQEMENLKKADAVKARDNHHSGVNTCAVFASIFYRHIV